MQKHGKLLGHETKPVRQLAQRSCVPCHGPERGRPFGRFELAQRSCVPCHGPEGGRPFGRFELAQRSCVPCHGRRRPAIHDFCDVRYQDVDGAVMYATQTWMVRPRPIRRGRLRAP